MDMEAQVIEAVKTELERQAAEGGERLSFQADGTQARIEGQVDLEGLAAAIVGAVAGGP